MNRTVGVTATARHYIARVIDESGGPQAVAALEPKLLRRLIKNSFCLQEACKCSKEQCVCLPCEKKIGLKYRKALWSKEFKKQLRRASNAHLNSVLAPLPI